MTLKKVKKSEVRVAHPLKNFTVSYTPATDSVTLNLTGAQTFPSGGRITVLPGVTDNSGSVLTGTTVFKITAGGKKIEPSYARGIRLVPPLAAGIVLHEPRET